MDSHSSLALAPHSVLLLLPLNGETLWVFLLVWGSPKTYWEVVGQYNKYFWRDILGYSPRRERVRWGKSGRRTSMDIPVPRFCGRIQSRRHSSGVASESPNNGPHDDLEHISGFRVSQVSRSTHRSLSMLLCYSLHVYMSSSSSSSSRTACSCPQQEHRIDRQQPNSDRSSLADFFLNDPLDHTPATTLFYRSC